MESENTTIQEKAEETPVQTLNKNMKPCKVCGKMIAKKAKTCPYCGAKNKKSHKGLIALLIIIVVAAIAVVVVKINGTNIFTINSTPTSTSAPSEEVKAEIIDNDGNIVYMTADEVSAAKDENEARFKKLYIGAKIEFTGTVESVRSDYTEYGWGWRFDSITFEEGWKVVLPHGEYDDILMKLSAGSKVKVNSNIFYADHFDVDVRGTGESGGTNINKMANTRLSLVE